MRMSQKRIVLLSSNSNSRPDCNVADKTLFEYPYLCLYWDAFRREVLIDRKINSFDNNNNELRTTVYRKPTHTDRLLDQSSYNPTSHKATTIKTDETSGTSV